ncbi:MAG TPA: type II toxin-antitoxin system PemK/MazF family toxin [Bacillus sp. (in: firmicutes)]|nr:type II toxin-antitoxin system PemK/MazF family toxin [Bacillus sp. (in: firmicutes)]
MHIDRELLDRLRKDKTIKRTPSHQQTDVSDEIRKILPIIENHFTNASTVEKSSNWMLYKDLWLQNEIGHLKQNVEYRNYTRGSIIMSVEWGTTNIGTEIRYPHPGVVLYDQKEDWVIAAPITGAKIDQQTQQPISHPPFEILAFKQNTKPTDSNEYWFRKHSVIQVDQIQRISKYRALNKKSYKIRPNLLNQIDNCILEYFIPGKHQLTETLKAELLTKKDELIAAQEEIKSLKEEIKKLKQEF